MADDHVQIDNKSINSYDPINKFLSKKINLSPLAFGMIVFFADLLVDCYLGWRYKAFLSTSTTPGLLQDYMALVTDFIFNPIICGTYLWSFVGTDKLFDELVNSNILVSKDEFTKLFKKYQHYYSSKIFTICALIAALFFSILQTTSYQGLHSWKVVGGYLNLNPTMSLFRMPFWFLTFYCLLYLTYNIGVTIIILRKLFRTAKIDLLPLHPDRCGGLGSINKYSTKVAFAIGAVGLMSSAAVLLEIQQRTLLRTPSVLIGMIAYMILAPLFFFWPLGTAHNIMRDTKEKHLLCLAKQYSDIYSVMKESLFTNSANYERDLLKLKDVKEIYNMISKDFPIWPFDMRSFRRFFAIVTAPIIPSVLSILFEVIFKSIVR